MAYYSNESGIVAKPFVFDESYVPDRIEDIEQELKKLKTCIEPAKRQMKPLNCWIHGPSGSGKTCAVKWVLSNAEKDYKLGWTYINCWDTPTYYLVLDRLVRNLRILGAEAQIAGLKLEAIFRFLRDKPFVIILDELDIVAPRQRNTILYNLSQLEKTGLFCITYNHKSFAELDARVRSRISPVYVSMPSYKESLLLAILRNRAEFGLMQDTWSAHCLEKIAKLAAGNSRIAIQTLRNAVFLAEKRREKKISIEHIDEGWNGTEDLKKRSLLNSLTPHHRLLYEIVQSQGVVASGTLWRLYLDMCKARNITSIALRTYSLYVKQLVNMRFLSEEFVVAKGRKRMLKALPIAGTG